MDTDKTYDEIIYRGEIVAHINKATRGIKIINRNLFIQMKSKPDDNSKYKKTEPRKYIQKSYGTIEHPKKYRIGTKNYMKNIRNNK